MPLPREACQEDSLEPGPQDISTGSDPQAAPIGITEEPASVQGIETRSDTPSSYTGEVSHYLGRIHQESHSNSAKNPNEINLDAAMLSSRS